MPAVGLGSPGSGASSITPIIPANPSSDFQLSILLPVSQRISRINALLQREVSEQMRRYYRAETAAITISDVDCSTDLRHARIYYSVLGDAKAITEAEALFRKIGKDLRQRVSKQIILKYFPRFEFMYDPSLERGAEINELLDRLEEDDAL
jgi:ribosome-binding factor A